MRLGVAAAFVDGGIVPGDVDVDGGLIRAVALEPAGPGGLAVPGFVDLQVNGFVGVDFLSATPDDYRTAGSALLATGVTAYQPTLITSPPDMTAAALQVVARARASGGGPRVLGAHLEGPFLSPARAGAHPPEQLRDPDLALLERLLAAGPVTTMTLAPELAGALALVARLREAAVLVSCGHSDADAAEARRAFDAGARAVTHLHNAMRPFRPRDPGIAGAALARADVTVQVIVDGVHLAADTVLATWRAARGRLALVTDAVAAAGRPDGRYRLGAVEVVKRGGAVRRADGTLAGSVLTMDAAVRTAHGIGLPLVDALAAATAVPAALLGARGIGRLEPGGPADVVVLDDRLEVRTVLRDGRPA